LTLRRLSVLDIGPIRQGQSSTQAFAAMLALAECADRLGFHRFWLAEHHNVPATVASLMPVFAPVVASQTSHIRVGGNILLPHYPPFLVAEQAAILEACFPGRVDLALGDAAGADRIASAMLRGGRQSEDFGREVHELALMLDPAGLPLQGQGIAEYRLKATPRPDAAPALWIWGTRRAHAALAGRLGLPFMYGYHIVGRAEMDAVRVYRESFTPSPRLEAPQALASAIVVAGRESEEAERFARPHLRTMIAFRSGALDHAQLLVGKDAELPPLDAAGRAAEANFRESWIVGSPDSAAQQVRELAAELDVDEIMVNPVAAANATDPPSSSPNREYTLEVLADRILGG
jgi:luciferase family oxidoreductase group 1